MSFYNVQHSQYNNHNDIDGLFLNSLSLDDKSNHLNLFATRHSPTDFQQSYNQYENYSDDQMDIDVDEDIPVEEDSHGHPTADTVEFDEPIDSTTTTNHGEIEVEEDPKEEEEDSSFISNMFSPTMLGAKLAINRPRLLLMPPPLTNKSTPPDDHIDHEYDTSLYKPIKPNQDNEMRNRWRNDRNMSLFSPVSDINSFLAREGQQVPKEQQYDQMYGGNGRFYANNMNLSYMMRKSFGVQNAPVTIHHHHHYYGNGSSDSIKLNDTSLNLQDIVPTQKEQQLEKYQHPYQGKKSPQKLILPVPWKSNITPLEKVPYVLSSYLQIFINFTATLYSFYLISGIISSIKHDISYKLAQQSTHILTSIETCRRAYHENKCHPDTIVPLLETKCAYFERCMQQDPFNGGGNMVKISAETIGVLVNSLIEPLGWKFFMFVLMFVVTVFACNFSFGYIRAKSYYGWTGQEKKPHLDDDMIID